MIHHHQFDKALAPPEPGHNAWTETVLHYFNVSTSGQTPLGERVANPAGQLFGVTYEDEAGLGGTVFAVTP